MTRHASQRHLDRDELTHFARKIHAWWSDGDVFFECRRMEREAAEQGVMVTNLLQIYHWLKEIRDQMKKDARSKQTG
ncbi:MAG: hypothetical protein ACYSPI_00785 [Planctomycetota bacterium]|jgi:hypothetical protein